MTLEEAPNPISRSALFVAAGRAIGAREPDPAARNPDHLAETLLGDPSILNQEVPTVRALRLDYDEAMQDLTIVNCVRMTTVRTRFIDDALNRAISRGVKQIVMLGAGLDSYAYRRPDLLEEVRVFEVDRPVMQAFKRQRVAIALGAEPTYVTYVTADFQRDKLDEILASHGCNVALETLFVMEGVSMYLPAATVSDILALVARHRSGSGIVLDFLFGRALRAPRGFVLPREGAHKVFGDRGLTLQKVLAVNGEEAAALYLTRTDGTQIGARTIEEAMCRIVEDPATLPRRSPWGGIVWQAQGPLRYHVAKAVVP